MHIELIRSPSESFLQMLLNHVRPSDRKELENVRWGAVGLIQARLIHLYWAADIAEKASNIRTALVMGNCPQHIQVLAIFGQQAAVQAALDSVKQRAAGKTS